jgi:hypothetical protein
VREPGEDRIVVSVAAVLCAWTVEIDLAQGMATSRPWGVPMRGPFPIAADALASLRAHAARAFAGGDLEHREQFADGQTEVLITLGGRTVTLLYVTDGVSHHERAEELYQFALTCL